MTGEGAGFGPSPSADEVRAELERIPTSEPLRPSAQLQAFLRFVVEATLKGEAERIRAFTIAVEAFGRDKDFDPQSDPIVRVEAARLRRAIELYYNGPGADDLLAGRAVVGEDRDAHREGDRRKGLPVVLDPRFADRFDPAQFRAMVHI